MSGKLSLVATPIGNLEDMTLRAIRILSEADLIYAEDTRRTAQLLNHYGLKKSIQSYHEHNEVRRSEEMVQLIQEGKKIALVTDAGTPGISDPGFRVVNRCITHNLPIEILPGPCAAIAALMGSGLPTHEFHFSGFLPQKAVAAEKRLRELVQLPVTLVLYESPYRVVRTLELLLKLAPERKVVIARELTKKFEEFRRESVQELVDHFRQHPPKGEFVILVGPV